ncbi:hypothetical protein [Streptomyces phaeochromogenes]
MRGLEDLALHVLEADDHYRAWKALQELAGRGDDFVDLAVAGAADPHRAAAWGSHFAQARATATTLAASIDATRSFLEDHGLTCAE